MNSCHFVGRTTRDVQVSGDGDTMSARTGLALNRPPKKNGESNGADFVNIVGFGSKAKLLRDHVPKGTFVVIETHVSTSSYVNKKGDTVYSTDFIIDKFEFGPKVNRESTQNSPQQNKSQNNAAPVSQQDNGFADMPDGIDDEGLPWDM